MCSTTQPKINTLLGLGANTGDAIKTLKSAVLSIARFINKPVQLSSLYNTTPLYHHDNPGQQPDYHNLVLGVVWNSPAQELFAFTSQLETELGLDRTKKGRWGPRPIDIDLLLVRDLVLNESSLTLPHPEMQNRDFVLVPCNEIAAEMIHPVLGKSVRELTAEHRSGSLIKETISLVDFELEVNREVASL